MSDQRRLDDSGAQRSSPRVRPGVEVQRQHVLQAAREEVTRVGVDGLTAQRLAEAAGISRATFYRCFSSVDDVVQQMFAEYAMHVSQRLSRFLADGDNPREMLPGLIDQIITDAEANRTLLLAMVREEMRASDEALLIRRARIDTQVELIAAWWSERSGLPADPMLIRMFVLLLQIVGVDVALNDDLTATKRAQLRDACQVLIEATTAAYVARQR